MMGRTCLVTGASGGIGKATATGLAQLGAAVIVGARDSGRGATAAEDIRRLAPGAAVDVVTGDLADPAQVRAMAAQVRARYQRLDVLVNNAGMIAMTPDGFGRMFAVNHLAPFLLTNLLGDLLQPGARVVTVASNAHRRVTTMPWDDLPGGGYPVSKLANVLFTAELARRWRDRGVTANCLHPGFVRTGIGRDVPDLLGAALGIILLMRPSAAKGARTSIHLASSPEVAGVSGGYFMKCRPAEPSALARDEEAAARLWAISEGLVAGHQ